MWFTPQIHYYTHNLINLSLRRIVQFVERQRDQLAMDYASGSGSAHLHSK